MISDQRIRELMGWSADPAHVTGVLGGGPDDLPARVREVAQAAADAARAESGQTLDRVVLAQTEPGGVCARCGGWVCDPVMPQQAEPWVKTYCGGKPNYTTPEEP